MATATKRARETFKPAYYNGILLNTVKMDCDGKYVRKRSYTLREACEEVARVANGHETFLCPNYGVVIPDSHAKYTSTNNKMVYPNNPATYDPDSMDIYVYMD